MYKPEPVKEILNKFQSVPIILEAPNRDVMKYFMYRGFTPRIVSSMFSWLRVVLPANIVEDLMELLGINKYYVDYAIMLWGTRKIDAANLSMLPISFTTTQLGFDAFHRGEVFDYNATGKGIKVGVVDTGANKVFSKAIYTDASNIFGIYDFNGHGTHVASIIGAPYDAPKYDDIDMFGVAPECKLHVYNALPIGTGTISEIIAGIERVYNKGAKIINLSLGSDVPDNYDYSQDALVQFIDKLCSQDKDLLFVAASGNSGAGVISTPAISPNVLAVGSISYLDGDSVAWFSSYGEIEIPSGTRKIPDVVAYGGGRADRDEKYDEYILGFTGSNASDLTDGLTPNNFGIMHGTSQAAPHVSGAFAILRDIFANYFKTGINLNAQKVRNFLADEYSYDSNGKGYGKLNADMLKYIIRRFMLEVTSGEEITPVPPPPSTV